MSFEGAMGDAAGAASPRAIAEGLNIASPEQAKETAKQLQGLLITGDLFIFHHAAKNPQQFFVFYRLPLQTVDGKDLGSLAWGQPGTRAEQANQTIPLANITELVLGRKSTGSAQEPLAGNIAANTCFSIVAGDKQRIDVECRSNKLRDDW
jgi:hypothetical protein